VRRENQAEYRYGQSIIHSRFAAPPVYKARLTAGGRMLAYADADSGGRPFLRAARGRGWPGNRVRGGVFPSIAAYRPGRLAPYGDAGSYASAVAASSASVVNVYSARRMQSQPPPGDPFERGYFDNPPQHDRTQTNLGSGVIVSSDGYILTNYHVVSGAEAIQVGLSDGRSAPARVVGVDPDTDLALIKINLPHLRPIHMGRSDDLHVGDVVLAIGDPYGVGQTVTHGIVSALAAASWA